MSLLTQWLKCLPKALWELKADHVPTSRIIISTLLDFARRSPASAASAQALNEVQETMIPFFFTVFAVKKTVRTIHGPFVSLPEDVQRRSLDILSYFSRLSLAMLRAVAACCLHASVSPTVAVYAINVVQSVRMHIPAEEHVSFMMSMLLGKASPDLLQAHVCSCMLNLQAGATLGLLVAPLLEQVLNQPQPPPETLHGAAKCVATCTKSATQDGSTVKKLPFPSSTLPLISNLLWTVLRATNQQSTIEAEQTEHRNSPKPPSMCVPPSVVSAISHMPALWPLLLDHAKTEMRTFTEATEAAIILYALINNLSGQAVVVEHADKVLQLVQLTEDIAGSNATQHASRLRALTEYYCTQSPPP